METKRIDVPNTHALHDPGFARDQAIKHFSPWLDVGRAIESYGANLLLRAMSTSAESVAALVVIGGMFRHVLAAADGALLCLEHGAVQQSMLHSRSMYEGSIGIQWTLNDDWEGRARRYYVSSLRQNRTWLQRQIPGTPENRRSEKAWEKIGEPPRRSDETERQARDGLAEIDQLLRDPDYREINEWFEQYGKKGKGKNQYFSEPYWYQPGPGGTQTLGMLAKAVGREAEYETIYKYTSYFVHGSLAENHFKTNEGRTSIEPLRYLKQFATAFNGTFIDLASVIMLITRHFRHAELPQALEHYREWRPMLLSHAHVTVEPDIVRL